MSSFVFTVATTDYTSYSANICPIINVNSSFSGLTSNVVSADGTTTITWSWTAFTDNGTTNDGLKIYGNAGCALNVASLNITQYGGIPFSRNSISGFSGFTGQITATDTPTILTNTNLSDIINQIEPLQKENEALRGLLNSQQTTLNELSGLVMKLLNNGLPTYGSNNANDGDYLNYDASASVTEYNADDVIKVDTNSNAVDGKDAVVEEADEAEEADALDDGVES